MTTSHIPNWSYRREYQKHNREIDRAIKRVLASGRLILGPQLERFEGNFSRWVGAKFGIGCNSGTDAIFLALRALEVGPGDEVITVPNTAVPTVAAIRATGATPVFVDIDPETYLMDVSQVPSRISKKTKAIVPVHLYGQSVDMEALLAVARKHKLHIVEDCAQSHGARYRRRMTGTLGTIGTFSFYPTKVLGAYGDAGMCVTNDAKLAKTLTMLRMYGMKGEYYSEIEGYNTRLDEVQAAILNVKVRYLKAAIRARQKIAARYDKGLRSTLKVPERVPWGNHVFYLYVVAHPERQRIIEHLANQGIGIKIHFPDPIHLMRAYQFLGYRRGDFPATERAASEIFSLPMFPELKETEIKKVIKEMRNTYGKH